MIICLFLAVTLSVHAGSSGAPGVPGENRPAPGPRPAPPRRMPAPSPQPATPPPAPVCDDTRLDVAAESETPSAVVLKFTRPLVVPAGVSKVSPLERILPIDPERKRYWTHERSCTFSLKDMAARPREIQPRPLRLRLKNVVVRKRYREISWGKVYEHTQFTGSFVWEVLDDPTIQFLTCTVKVGPIDANERNSPPHTITCSDTRCEDTGGSSSANIAAAYQEDAKFPATGKTLNALLTEAGLQSDIDQSPTCSRPVQAAWQHPRSTQRAGKGEIPAQAHEDPVSAESAPAAGAAD